MMRMYTLKSVLSRYAVLAAAALVILLSGSQSNLAGSPSPNGAQAADIPLGKTIYEAQCSRCHGLEGKGDGPAASLLTPRPRNFSDGKFKFRSTESGSIPTDDDLMKTIKSGLHGTSMPDWEPFLRGDSLKVVMEYVKSFSHRFTDEQPKPVRIGSIIPSSEKSIASGKKVFETLQCAKCHGDDGMGKNAVATELKDDLGHDIQATNLTEPWSFRGGATARDIYLRFRTGIDGTPMPSYIGSASDKEMWDLANYVVSLGRKPVWEMTEQEVKTFYAALDADAKANPVKRGKYLVTTMGCGDCHTPYRPDGGEIEELYLAGGQRWSLGPYGSFVTPNLTPDKETGLGGRTDDQIKDAMRKGIRKDGSRMLPFPMPWPDYSHLTNDDMNAIIAYLRTVSPVSNKIPDQEPKNIISYLIAKFGMLILKEPITAGIEYGNAGSAKAQSSPNEQ